MGEIITPPFLKPNDKIGIIAPAGYLTSEMIAPSLKFLEQQGYEVVLGENMFNLYDFGYKYAGTLTERLTDLQTMLNDKTIKAIWCARGGYGCIELVDKLDFTNFHKNPKWLIGYSDVTVLHQKINQSTASIHATTTKLLPSGQTDETLTSLFEVLKGDLKPINFSPQPQNELGEAQGILVGGNLSILYSLLGSETLFAPTGKILFIEDWCENYYHLDRMLMSLKRSGVFNQINGLLVGGMTLMDDKEGNENHTKIYDQMAYNIVQKYMQDYNFPIVYGVPAGHIQDNRALVFGLNIKMNCTKIISEIIYL